MSELTIEIQFLFVIDEIQMPFAAWFFPINLLSTNRRNEEKAHHYSAVRMKQIESQK